MSKGQGTVAQVEKLVKDARAFLERSSIVSVRAQEIDQAVALIRRMADALDAQPVGRFANDECLGKIRVEDNSRTMLGRWSAEEIDPNHHFHIWSDMPCKGGDDCPAPKDEGGAR